LFIRCAPITKSPTLKLLASTTMPFYESLWSLITSNRTLKVFSRHATLSMFTLVHLPLIYTSSCLSPVKILRTPTASTHLQASKHRTSSISAASMPMTPARIWLGGFRDSQLRQPREERKSADKTTTERTADLAPTTPAKAWLGEFVVPGSLSPEKLTESAERTRDALLKKEVNASKPAQPEAAHHSTTKDGRRSAPCLMTMDASGNNTEMHCGYFGPF